MFPNAPMASRLEAMVNELVPTFDGNGVPPHIIDELAVYITPLVMRRVYVEFGDEFIEYTFTDGTKIVYGLAMG